MHIHFTKKETDMFEKMASAAHSFAQILEDDAVIAKPKWVKITEVEDGYVMDIPEKVVTAVCDYMHVVYNSLGSAMIVLKSVIIHAVMPKAVELAEILEEQEEEEEAA